MRYEGVHIAHKDCRCARSANIVKARHSDPVRFTASGNWLAGSAFEDPAIKVERRGRGCQEEAHVLSQAIDPASLSS